MAFAEQMALRSFSFEVTAWTRAGCFLIPRYIALYSVIALLKLNSFKSIKLSYLHLISDVLINLSEYRS